MMGMLAGFIGGVANTGQKMLQFDREREGRMTDRMAEMDYAAELDLKKQQAVEALRAKVAEATAQRDAAMRVEADEAGRQTLQGRNFEQFKRDLGQTDATDEQLRQVFEQQYFDRDVAPGDANSKRFDPKDSEFTGAARTEAMKRGASSGLINSLTTEKKEQEGLERYADQTERQARLDAQRERKEQAQLEQGERRVAASERTAEASVIRAERAGSSAGKPDDKLSETQKARLDILKRNVLEAEKALGDAGTIKSRRDAAQARVEEAYRKLDEFTAQVDGKPSTPKPPATENKPAATPPVSRLQEGRQTTFANGQVWTLKNGKAVQVK